jgi:hypothetical protein
VPGLRGVFTITMSENLTSCHSHSGGAACPRCSKRSGPEVVAEVNRLIAEGAWEASPDAEVIAWDWGWPDGWAESIIGHLPQNIRLQSVSEWSLPIRRGGIAHHVGEYSISAVGPGPRAERNWSLAKKHGLRIGAKVQVNNTWELSTVPYIPAVNLVAEHFSRLRKTGVTSLMLSWTLGGWPSPNLDVARLYYGENIPEPATALSAVARQRYGPAAEVVLEAWKHFSDAFREFPFDITVLYNGPQQWGPANLLYPEPSGYRATMVGFPYDDLARWRGVYPEEVFAGQFEKVAKEWRVGLRALEQAIESAPATYRTTLTRDLGVARACELHFHSVALQAKFVMARGRALASSEVGEQREALETMGRLCREESRLAKELYRIAARDARIGYEASNHYFYLPRDLIEKAINCRHIEERWIPARER